MEEDVDDSGIVEECEFKQGSYVLMNEDS